MATASMSSVEVAGYKCHNLATPIAKSISSFPFAIPLSLLVAGLVRHNYTTESSRSYYLVVLAIYIAAAVGISMALQKIKRTSLISKLDDWNFNINCMYETNVISPAMIAFAMFSTYWLWQSMSNLMHTNTATMDAADYTLSALGFLLIPAFFVFCYMANKAESISWYQSLMAAAIGVFLIAAFRMVMKALGEKDPDIIPGSETSQYLTTKMWPDGLVMGISGVAIAGMALLLRFGLQED